MKIAYYLTFLEVVSLPFVSHSTQYHSKVLVVIQREQVYLGDVRERQLDPGLRQQRGQLGADLLRGKDVHRPHLGRRHAKDQPVDKAKGILERGVWNVMGNEQQYRPSW